MRKILLLILLPLLILISKEAFSDSIDVRYKKAVIYLKNNEKVYEYIKLYFEEYLGTFNIGDEIFKHDYFYYDDKYPEDYDQEYYNSQYYFADSSIANIVVGKRMSKKEKLTKLSFDPENKYHLFFSDINDNMFQAELFYATDLKSRRQWFLGTGFVFRFTFDENQNLTKVEGSVMAFD
jgi:hypothetical protein